MLRRESRVRNCPNYLRFIREPSVRPGDRIIWLARLSGRGDHLFPVPGVVVAARRGSVTIVVQAYGGTAVRRVVQHDRVRAAED